MLNEENKKPTTNNNRREPADMSVIVKAKDLVKYTFYTTRTADKNNTKKNNKNNTAADGKTDKKDDEKVGKAHFPKSERFTLIDVIKNTAREIFRCLLYCNELNAKDEREKRERIHLQTQAITYCKELNYYIELSQTLNYITLRQMEYWGGLVVEVKKMVVVWRINERKTIN